VNRGWGQLQFAGWIGVAGVDALAGHDQCHAVVFVYHIWGCFVNIHQRMGARGGQHQHPTPHESRPIEHGTFKK